MTRTISITELQNSGIESWSVKDDSPRGITTKYASQIEPGDEVVIDNHFTTVTEEPAQEAAGATTIAETPKEKERRTFEYYKHRLIYEGGGCHDIRYNVIQYLCSFPGIDPGEMAAVLLHEGHNVLFDDSSISAAQNAANRRRVCKLLPVLDKDNAKVGAAYQFAGDYQIVRRIYRISEDYAREHELTCLDRVETSAGDFALPGSDIFRD